MMRVYVRSTSACTELRANQKKTCRPGGVGLHVPLWNLTTMLMQAPVGCWLLVVGLDLLLLLFLTPA